jgi:hypothetical protein
MLRKYRGQLAGIGIDYDAIPEPPKSESGDKPARLITIDDAGYARIYSPYDANLVTLIKALPGARFDGQKKAWWLKLDATNAQALLDFAVAHRFEFADKLINAIEGATNKPAPAPARFITLSGGQTATIHFDYDPAMVNRVKALPGARFDAKTKTWTLKLTRESARELLQWAQTYGFEAKDLPEVVQSLEEAYSERLEGSRAKEATLEVEGLGGTLRPFQKAGVAYAVEAKRAFICDEMGLGKTVEALATIQAAQAFPACIVCPASLKLNWKREAEKWLPGKRLAMVNGGKNGIPEEADIVILNYDVLKKNLEALQKCGFKAVVFDESHYCFPAGTMVETDRGPLPIEEIVSRRLDVSVLSCNLSNNALEFKPIKDWLEFNLYADLVRVAHEQGEFTCTADHPVWTKDGYYVEAGTLKSSAYLQVVSSAVPNAYEGETHCEVLQPELCGDIYEQQAGNQSSHLCQIPQASYQKDLRVVQETVSASIKRQAVSETSILRTELCCFLADEPASPERTEQESNCLRSKFETREKRSGFIGKNEAEQPHVKSRNSGKDAAGQNGTDIPVSWGQRSIDRTPEDSFRKIEPTRGISYSNCTSQTSLSFPPECLQGGFGRSRPETGNRSGRAISPDTPLEISGQTKNGSFGRSRVVRVEVLQSGGYGEPGASGNPDPRVYCLSVADNENFFANGVLVSNCKNYKAARTEAAKDLAKKVPIRLALTGTPVLNRPQELLSQLQIIGRLEEMGGFWEFAKRYCCAQKTRFGWDFSGAAHLDELNEKLRSSCYIRRTKEEVLSELPPKTRTIVPVELTNRREYDRAQADVVSWLGQQAAKEDAFLASVADLLPEEQRRAISDHRMSAEETAARAEQLVRIEALKQLAARGKMEAVKEWVESLLETGEKLVIFAHHQVVVEELAQAFNAPSITGQTPVEARQAAVDRFQTDPNCRVIVCNIKAGGVGLTLTAASNVAFIELEWTPAAHDQAEDRCHRIGQTDSVMAWYLLGQATIDEEIMSLIETKRQVVDAATEGSATGAETGILSELVDRLRGGKTRVK